MNIRHRLQETVSTIRQTLTITLHAVQDFIFPNKRNTKRPFQSSLNNSKRLQRDSRGRFTKR